MSDHCSGNLLKMKYFIKVVDDDVRRKDTTATGISVMSLNSW
jgi:hypothetical protein